MEEITLKEFAKLVQMMRHNQRRYFSTRNYEVLKSAKELEKQVDQICADITNVERTLFDT